MGHPAKRYCMACSLVNLHNKNASNEALLVCEKSRPDCERQITSRDDFSINQNESSSSFGYERYCSVYSLTGMNTQCSVYSVVYAKNKVRLCGLGRKSNHLIQVFYP